MTVTGEGGIEASAKSRMNFAGQHMFTAQHAALRVREIEVANMGAPFGPFFNEIMYASTTAVMSAVAALEAYMGEVRFEPETNFPGQPPEFLSACLRFTERGPFFERLKFLSLLNGKPLPDFDVPPGNAIAVLIWLRNSLVHFTPEWPETGRKHASLSKELRGFFQPTTFLDPSEPLFPRGCMSYSCAKWAVESVREFVIELADTNGWPCGYRKHAEALALP